MGSSAMAAEVLGEIKSISCIRKDCMVRVTDKSILANGDDQSSDQPIVYSFGASPSIAAQLSSVIHFEKPARLVLVSVSNNEVTLVRDARSGTILAK